MGITITYDFNNPDVRKIVVGKDCYSKYCANCPFRIDAFWEEKEGFKYGWMGIICCKYPCEKGVGWGIELGRKMDFNPTQWYDSEALKRIYKDTWCNETIERKEYYD